MNCENCGHELVKEDGVWYHVPKGDLSFCKYYGNECNCSCDSPVPLRESDSDSVIAELKKHTLLECEEKEAL